MTILTQLTTPVKDRLSLFSGTRTIYMCVLCTFGQLDLSRDTLVKKEFQLRNCLYQNDLGHAYWGILFIDN